MLRCDTYNLPTSLRDALELWSGAPEGSRLVSGATDILPWGFLSESGPAQVVGDLRRLLRGACQS